MAWPKQLLRRLRWPLGVAFKVLVRIVAAAVGAVAGYAAPTHRTPRSTLRRRSQQPRGLLHLFGRRVVEARRLLGTTGLYATHFVIWG